MAKKYRLLINPVAEEDIQEIRDYIAADNPTAAARWAENVERLILALESFPLAFEVIPEAKMLGVPLRQKLCGHYRIIYRVENDDVMVLRVIHGARLLDRSLFEM